MNAEAYALSYPHIGVDPAVSGGQPVVLGTRIPVATLVRSQQLGMDFDEILLQYPTLTPAELHAAFAYYLDHKTEVDELLQKAELPPEGAAVLEL